MAIFTHEIYLGLELVTNSDKHATLATMANWRMSKKKVTSDPIASKKEASVVTQVVEEVPEDKPIKVLEEIQEDAKNIEMAAEKLEDVIRTSEQAGREGTPPVTAEEEVSSEAEPMTPESLNVTKELTAVVSELYKPQPADIPTEVIADSRSSVKSIFVWSLVVIGIALLTGGTLLVAVKGMQGAPLVAKPSPPPAGEPTPAPPSTPIPAVSRSNMKVQVLNGGGVAGSGAKMKALLEEKGYTVTDVKNADEFTFEETEVHVKSGKDAYADLLKKDLAEKYTIGSSTAVLAADSAYEAQVIVGKK